MDKDLSLLTATGSAICGAAAVLGAESVIKPQPYKTAVAVSTVVIFGTIAMFIYPMLYRSGVTGLDETGMGVYTGSTLHEVAHVVGAGNAMGENISDTAIIVKMIRVILLAPVLLAMSFFTRSATGTGGKKQITIPWFAFGFIAVIGFNSLNLLPASVVGFINNFDTFLLTMAMTALGARQVPSGRSQAIHPCRHTFYMAHGRRLSPRPLPRTSAVTASVPYGLIDKMMFRKHNPDLLVRVFIFPPYDEIDFSLGNKISFISEISQQCASSMTNLAIRPLSDRGHKFNEFFNLLSGFNLLSLGH